MLKFKSHYESAEIQYHIEHGITLGELFRVGSSKYYSLFREVRYLHNEDKIELTGTDLHLIENTEIGEFADYEDFKEGATKFCEWLRDNGYHCGLADTDERTISVVSRGCACKG